jgi:hypothetical protein
MEDWQKIVYYAMIILNRGLMIKSEDKLIAFIAYWIGDNDDKYLYERVPWTIIEDDPQGTTLYIDQLLTIRNQHKGVHSKFTELLKEFKHRHPTIERVKWSRAPVRFRKLQIPGGRPNVYCRSIIE